MCSSSTDGAQGRRHRCSRWTMLAAFLVNAAVGASAWGQAVFQPVPEGQPPPGIVAASRPARTGTLETHPAGGDAVLALTTFARRHWSELATVDVVKLSRVHLEATRGWQLPAHPTFHDAELLAADDEALYLMLRGPRLPASFEIVHRYLVFYARYELASGDLAAVSVSIRGEVHE